MIKLPKGIRIPNGNEYPNGYVVEGFQYKIKNASRWSYVARISIDADKFWSIFDELSNKLLIRGKARGMIGFKEEQPEVGKQKKVQDILSDLSNYRYELLNDGYIEFGITDYNKKSFCQIYVNNYKTIMVFGNKIETLLEIMLNNGIDEIKDLKVINDFPVVSEALCEEDGLHYTQVIEEIKEKICKE